MAEKEVTMRAQLSMTHEHPVVKAYRVNDQHLLPGFAYVDLLYQTFQNRGIDFSSLELREVNIHQPLLVSKTGSVLLDIECTQSNSGQWRIEARGQEQCAGRSTGEPQCYARAQMHRVEPCGFAERLDLQEIARSASRTIDLREFYSGLRHLGVIHGDFMRPEGRVHLSDTAIYVDSCLNDVAHSGAAKLLFHPALMDGSVACAVGALSLEANSEEGAGKPLALLLPFFFKSFRACRRLQRRCIARLRRDSIRQKDDVIYCTLEFFDEDGLKLAELRDVASRQVRHLASFGHSPALSGTRDEAATRSALAAKESDIAIVGMSGRFPKARNVEEFWLNLKSGTDCVTEIPADRWDHSQYFDSRPGTPGKTYSSWGGFLRMADDFDYDFFGYRTEEMRGQLDVREKLLLQIVRDLMASSGYTPELLQSRYDNRVGLYLGLFDYPDSSTWASWTITRISDFLGLTGPGLTVDSQSASSITALHLACQGIANGDCDAAIVASAFLLSPEAFITGSLQGLLATSSDCRCFSKSDGFILSEGAAAVMLRPLADAERDNDQILAVIKGTALNRGRGTSTERGANFRAGLRETTRRTPQLTRSMHAEVAREALRRAKVDPRSISYVETPLNGHPLFDGAVLSGVKGALEARKAGEWSCMIGSVESNVGHGVAVSALTQLVKVVLQLHHRKFVPSVHAATELADCGLGDTCFRISHSLQEWERPVATEGATLRQLPRRALLTSHGAGGTNGCAILQEYIPSGSGHAQSVGSP